MMRRAAFTGAAVAAAAVLVGVACSRAKEDQPTRTISREGSSTAPAGSEADQRGHALVRVIHAVPSGAAVNVFADDAKAFAAVTYKTVTPYREFPSERIDFKVRKSGKDAAEPLAHDSEGLSGGAHYTIVLLPGDNKGEPVSVRVLGDDMTPPDSGKAKVRVINATPDVKDIKLTAPGKKGKVADIGGPASTQSYDQVEPVAGPLEIRSEKNDKVLARVSDAQLEPGKLYTILFVGRRAGTPKLEALTVQDELTGVPEKGAESSER
jgi:hypothetical protein